MKNCAKYQSIIREYKINELPLIKRLSVRHHLAHCRECAAVFADESVIRNFFSMVPELKCPDHLAEQIAVKSFNKPEYRSRRIISHLFEHPRWAFSIVTAGIVIFFVLNYSFRNSPVTVSEYTPEEIALARKQAQWSLAYTGKVINDTEKEVIGDVIFNHLPNTIQKSLGKSLKIF